MHISATFNLNMLDQGRRAKVSRFFYSSSARIYPEYNQRNAEYGWEKLFSERLNAGLYA
jgi:nucleoside-diphosphate-sugar epimerase